MSSSLKYAGCGAGRGWGRGQRCRAGAAATRSPELRRRHTPHAAAARTGETASWRASSIRAFSCSSVWEGGSIMAVSCRAARGTERV